VSTAVKRNINIPRTLTFSAEITGVAKGDAGMRMHPPRNHNTNVRNCIVLICRCKQWTVASLGGGPPWVSGCSTTHSTALTQCCYARTEDCSQVLVTIVCSPFFPLPRLNSHSHALHSHGTHGIPVFPIPMHIYTTKVVTYYLLT